MVTAFTSDSPGEESDGVSFLDKVPLDAYGISGFSAGTVGLSHGKVGRIPTGTPQRAELLDIY